MARYLNGGSGGDGGGGRGRGGGGNPGTGTGSSGGSGLPVGENGGVLASTNYLLVPVQNAATNQCYLAYYDSTSFNDDIDASTYSYRSEDINILRVPTVRRVGLVYRDLGLVKLTVEVSGTDDNMQAISAKVTVQLGNQVPTNALLTKLVDITLVCYRPKISLYRNAGDGPLSIVSVTMIGTIDDTAL